MVTEVKQGKGVRDSLEFHEVMQMHEKGLIGDETALKECGFDPKEAKKKDISVAGVNYNQINSENQLKLQRIESARRNVEILAKVLSGGYCDKSKDKILSVMDNSLNVMNTISKI